MQIGRWQSEFEEEFTHVRTMQVELSRLNDNMK